MTSNVRRLVTLLAAMAMTLGLVGPAFAGNHATTGDVRGSTIQNIQFDALLGDPEAPFAGEFVGRIVGLRIDEAGMASGRIIGQIRDSEGNVVQRVNQAFEGFDITGVLDGEDENGVCPILFLELGPLFLDVLGLIVEIPDPVIVEVRAERGPGQLLGNLLCALLGILD
jgi:hypothetical protein